MHQWRGLSASELSNAPCGLVTYCWPQTASQPRQQSGTARGCGARQRAWQAAAIQPAQHRRLHAALPLPLPRHTHVDTCPVASPHRRLAGRLAVQASPDHTHRLCTQALGAHHARTSWGNTGRPPAGKLRAALPPDTCAAQGAARLQPLQRRGDAAAQALRGAAHGRRGGQLQEGLLHARVAQARDHVAPARGSRRLFPLRPQRTGTVHRRELSLECGVLPPALIATPGPDRLMRTTHNVSLPQPQMLRCLHQRANLCFHGACIRKSERRACTQCHNTAHASGLHAQPRCHSCAAAACEERKRTQDGAALPAQRLPCTAHSWTALLDGTGVGQPQGGARLSCTAHPLPAQDGTGAASREAGRARG